MGIYTKIKRLYHDSKFYELKERYRKWKWHYTYIGERDKQIFYVPGIVVSAFMGSIMLFGLLMLADANVDPAKVWYIVKVGMVMIPTSWILPTCFFSALDTLWLYVSWKIKMRRSVPEIDEDGNLLWKK